MGCASKPIHSTTPPSNGPIADQKLYQEKTTQEISLLNLSIEDVPNEYRFMVSKWLDYFQGRGRPYMERYLSRSTRYLPMMKEVLKNNGLPGDLVYIPLIESGFSPKARSHAGAVGYWQMIRGTAKRYDLKINNMVDERLDPIRSTESATLFLKGLYNLFGSWYLAIASYNVGENRVQHAVMKHLTRSFWELAHRKVLPKETVDYVPKFIAASMIAREPDKYGFNDIAFQLPLSFETVDSPKPVDLRKLSSLLQISYDDIRELNPSYRTNIAVPIQGDVVHLRIPAGKKEMIASQLDQAFTVVNSRTLASSPGTYKVRQGDNLSRIAKKFSTSISALKEANELKTGSLLRVGSLIRIPEGDAPRRSHHRKRMDSSRVKYQFHKVQAGETLTQIAKRYSITLPQLISENQMARKSSLRVGTTIKIPDYSRE